MLADWSWNKADINVHNAKFLGAAAKLAYNEKPEVEEMLASWKMDLVQFFDRNETQAYLAQSKDACILAFRGTQPDKIVDWLTDLGALQVPGPVGKVHGGFLTALNYIWPDVLRALQTKRGTRTLWITGHSLGGALAVLATAKLRTDPRNSQTVNGLYTYGQPRVGDTTFSKAFDQLMGAHTFRFVNYKDIVPRVPLTTMQFGDIGTFQYFNDQQWDPSTTWAQAMLHTVGTTVQELIKNNGVEDHMMERYLAKLDALANRDVMHGH